MDTLQATIDVAARQFGGDRDRIDVDAPIAELGVDSLDFLEFLFELEDSVGVPIPPDAVSGLETLRAVAARVDELVAAKHAAADAGTSAGDALR